VTSLEQGGTVLMVHSETIVLPLHEEAEVWS
jgi:hypothetical protein